MSPSWNPLGRLEPDSGKPPDFNTRKTSFEEKYVETPMLITWLGASSPILTRALQQVNEGIELRLRSKKFSEFVERA